MMTPAAEDHHPARAPFTSFDASAANVATRFSARERKAKRTSAEAARQDVKDENYRADGDDWCYWSWRVDEDAPLGLAAGEEVLASYDVEDYSPSEWFCNTGFVP